MGEKLEKKLGKNGEKKTRRERIDREREIG